MAALARSDKSLFLTQIQVAEMLGLSLSTVQKIVATGQLKPVTLTGSARKLFPKAAVLAWLDQFGAAVKTPASSRSPEQAQLFDAFRSPGAAPTSPPERQAWTPEAGTSDRALLIRVLQLLNASVQGLSPESARPQAQELGALLTALLSECGAEAFPAGLRKNPPLPERAHGAAAEVSDLSRKPARRSDGGSPKSDKLKVSPEEEAEEAELAAELREAERGLRVADGEISEEEAQTEREAELAEAENELAEEEAREAAKSKKG